MTTLANLAVESVRHPARSYADNIEQLNRMSVQKHYLAFRDIAWDAPQNELDRTDPRLALRADSPLGKSDWYRALPSEQRAEFGLEMTCQVFKFGIGFESTLSRGLLEFARTRPNRCPQGRYALHEVIEESQHSLMFQEFINQSGTAPQPVGRFQAFLDRCIARSAATFPELFFFFVLAGELFIDVEQRAQLRTELHPLLRRVLQIHVTEEARHVHFAELYLREHLPKLRPFKRRIVALLLPIALRDAQTMMLIPAPRLVRHFAIPASVLSQCFGPGSAHRRNVEQTAARVFELLGPHGRDLRVFA